MTNNNHNTGTMHKSLWGQRIPRLNCVAAEIRHHMSHGMRSRRATRPFFRRPLMSELATRAAQRADLNVRPADALAERLATKYRGRVTGFFILPATLADERKRILAA